MLKKGGIIFVTLGAVLMLSALLLFFFNQAEDRQAGQYAGDLLDDIQTVIAKSETIPTPEEVPNADTQPVNATEPTEETVSELPVVQIDGYGYIGYLTIADLALELPVMSEWDYDRLRIAPCRQFGSSLTDDLVIAAHNYKTHFGKLYSLKTGAEITFTDMNGVVNRYTLVRMEKLPPDAVDAVQNSGHDLVLYTCTSGSAARVVAFCDRVEEDTDETTE